MIRILVQVDTRHAASREMIAGVMRFAATHGDIEVQFSGAHPSSAPVEYFRSWKPDALIADATVHALSPASSSARTRQAASASRTSPRPPASPCGFSRRTTPSSPARPSSTR